MPANVVTVLKQTLFIYISRKNQFQNNNKKHSVVNTWRSNSCFHYQVLCRCCSFMWLAAEWVCLRHHHHKHRRVRMLLGTKANAVLAMGRSQSLCYLVGSCGAWVLPLPELSSCEWDSVLIVTASEANLKCLHTSVCCLIFWLAPSPPSLGLCVTSCFISNPAPVLWSMHPDHFSCISGFDSSWNMLTFPSGFLDKPFFKMFSKGAFIGIALSPPWRAAGFPQGPCRLVFLLAGMEISPDYSAY